MSTESLNRTSNIDVSVTQDNIKDFKSPPRRANMDVLRKRLLQEKKKREKKSDDYSFYSCSFLRRINNVNLLNF